MRKKYDFTDAIKNPYAAKLKKQITIRLDLDTVEYFKKIASKADFPYQKLINLYLRDCALNKRDLVFSWKGEDK